MTRLPRLHYLFVYNPIDGDVEIEYNDVDNPIDARHHTEIKPHISHPGRIDGYIFKIKGGYRIVNNDMKPIEDSFVMGRIMKQLKEDKRNDQTSNK